MGIFKKMFALLLAAASLLSLPACSEQMPAASYGTDVVCVARAAGSGCDRRY